MRRRRSEEIWTTSGDEQEVQRSRALRYRLRPVPSTCPTALSADSAAKVCRTWAQVRLEFLATDELVVAHERQSHPKTERKRRGRRRHRPTSWTAARLEDAVTGKGRHRSWISSRPADAAIRMAAERQLPEFLSAPLSDVGPYVKLPMNEMGKPVARRCRAGRFFTSGAEAKCKSCAGLGVTSSSRPVEREPAGREKLIFFGGRERTDVRPTWSSLKTSRSSDWDDVHGFVQVLDRRSLSRTDCDPPGEFAAVRRTEVG